MIQILFNMGSLYTSQLQLEELVRLLETEQNFSAVTARMCKSWFIAKQFLHLLGLHLEQHESPSDDFFANVLGWEDGIQITRRPRIRKTFCTALRGSGPKLREVFSDHDPTIDCRAQVVNIYDRRSGIGKPVFKLAPEGHEHRFTISFSGLRACHTLMLCCNRLLLLKQALWLRIARSMCDDRPFASSPFRGMASRGLFFTAFFCGICKCILSMQTLVPTYVSAALQGNHSNTVQASKRHPYLSSSYFNLVWQMSTNVGTGTALQWTRYGLPTVSSFSPTTYCPAGPFPMNGRWLNQEDLLTVKSVSPIQENSM